MMIIPLLKMELDPEVKINIISVADLSNLVVGFMFDIGSLA